MCGAEFIRQRPNFLIDGAEKFVQELATLPYPWPMLCVALPVRLTADRDRKAHFFCSCFKEKNK
jgi:hypothetical protein